MYVQAAKRTLWTGDWLTLFIYLFIYNMYLVFIATVQMWRSEDGSQKSLWVLGLELLLSGLVPSAVTCPLLVLPN